MECYIRAESWSSANVRKNAPISPGLPYEPTVCIIDEIKITDSVGEIIRDKNSHKELRPFLYDR